MICKDVGSLKKALRSMSLQQASRVNRFPMLASAKEPGIVAISLMRLCDLPLNVESLNSFLKMYSGSSVSSHLNAYVAGLIDGEGSLTIERSSSKSGDYYSARIDVGMTKSDDILKILQSTYGGGINLMRKKTAKWNEAKRWHIFGVAAASFLIQILPYLRLKKNQAWVCILMQAMIQARKAGWTKEMRKAGASLKREMHKLNKKGPNQNLPPGAVAQLVDGIWLSPQMDLFNSLAKFSDPFPKWGMVSDGALWELTRPERPTEGTGCGFWRTPSSSDGEGGVMEMREDATGHYKLRDHVQPVNTHMWPTPRESEWKGTEPLGSKSHEHRLDRQYLDATVQEAEQTSGSLNPDWVEWLMGFPVGFSDIECDEPEPHPGWDEDPAEMWPTPDHFPRGARINQNDHQVTLQDKTSRNPGMDRNIPRLTTRKENRVNRLKALGNAVVPQQAHLALRMLHGIE